MWMNRFRRRSLSRAPVVALDRAARPVVEGLEVRRLMHAGHDHAEALTTQEPIRIDVGNVKAAYMDLGSAAWATDTGFTGGKVVKSRMKVNGTEDDPLFSTRRQGDFTYSVPAADGTYTLSLLFVDTQKKPGKRLFHVDAEGQRVETNLDIAAGAGRKNALVRQHAVTITGGALDLAFTGAGKKHKALLSAIELVPVVGREEPPPAPQPPAAPGSLLASPQGAATIALTWTDNSSNETGFDVERSTDGGATYALIVTVPAGATGHADAGLAPGRYDYRVRAVNDVGPSGWSNVAAATVVGQTPPPPQQPPSAPSTLSVSANGPTEVALTWADNSADETGFLVERATGAGGNFAPITTLAANATSYADNAVSPNTAYTYRVRAVNAAGQSDPSNERSVTTPAPPPVPTAPTAPSGLNAEAAGPRQVALAWADNATDETAYVVERSTDGGNAFQTLATLGTNATSHTDNTVEPSTTYVYRVRATNNVGPSNPSNADTVTTPAEQPPPALTFTQIRWSNNTAFAPNPVGRAEALQAVVDGKLYVFAGFGSEGPITRSDVYDPATNTWAPIADHPRRLSHAGTVADGRNVYFAGGYIGNGPGPGWSQTFGTKEVWRYNVDSNTYDRMPDLPIALASGGLVVVGRNLHYFSGNNSQRVDVGNHYALNLDNPSAGWQTRQSLPVPRSHMGAAVMNGRIYAIGGQTGNDAALTPKADVHEYDPATDTWTAKANMPKPLNHISSATAVIGNRIVTFGGQTTHGSSVYDVLAYDPAADRWESLTPLPAPRFSGVAAFINGSIFFTTGSTSTVTWRGEPVWV